MKFAPATAAAVETAKRAIADIAQLRDAVEAYDALDEIGADLARCMEAVDAEAALLRVARESSSRKRS